MNVQPRRAASCAWLRLGVTSGVSGGSLQEPPQIKNSSRLAGGARRARAAAEIEGHGPVFAVAGSYCQDRSLDRGWVWTVTSSLLPCPSHCRDARRSEERRVGKE